MDGFNDVIQIDIGSDTAAGERCRKKLEEINSQAQKVAANFDIGAISEAKFNAQMDALQAKATQVNAAFEQSTTALKKVADQTGASGQRLMVLAQTLDDLQYVPEQGLRPIINNVIQLSPALGVALIAVQALGKAFISLAGQFGEGHVKTEAERIKELGDKVHKTAEEYQFLAKVQRGDKAIEAIANARPEAESKANKAAEAAIGNAGGEDALVPALVAADPGFADRQPAVIEAQKRLDEMIKKADDFAAKFGKGIAYDIMGFDNAITFMRKGLAETKTQAYDAVLATAVDGQDTPGGRARLADMLRKNPGALNGKAGDLVAELDLIGQGKDPAEAKKAKEQAAEQAKQADEKRRDELAGDLQGRYNVARAGGNDVTEANIRAELEAGGVKPEEVGKQAAGVLAKLQAGYAEELRERAGKEGTDQAGAAQSILDEAQKKADKATAKQETEDDKRAAELARPLQDRFNLVSAQGGGDDVIQDENVANELRAGGATDDEVTKHTAAVREKLVDGYNEELRKRAAEKGTDVAGAADSIVADDNKKRADALEKQINAARQGAEGAERDRAEQFRKATAGTGLDDRARMALIRSQLAGEDPTAAADRIGQGIAKTLVGQGMDPKQANAAASDYVLAQMNKLNDDVIGRGLNAREVEPMKAPERINVADFARQVESAGMDLQKRQVDLLDRLVELQQEAARRGTGYATAAPG